MNSNVNQNYKPKSGMNAVEPSPDQTLNLINQQTQQNHEKVDNVKH